MKFLKQLFTWWNSQTLGTMIYTWRRGVLVGSDEFGNLFYEARDSDRRWVIFKNSVDASLVSSEWHGWLHHTVYATPIVEKPFRKVWEKPHQQNKTIHPIPQSHLS